MSDHDFDTNGLSEEELRELLRSLPRRDAPGDFEPELMRRVAGIRRRRGVLSVLHTGARAEWVGGVVSATVAAVVVAGAWLFMCAGDPADSTNAPAAASPIVAVAPPVAASPLGPRLPMPSSLDVRPKGVPEPGQATMELSSAAATSMGAARQTSAPTRGEASRRSSASTAPSRRGTASPSARRRMSPVVAESVRSIDTIAAARVRIRPTPRPIPTPTEAGSRTAHPEMGAPAPAPTLHGEPTGVDTGGRAR